MLLVNPALMYGIGEPKKRPKLVLALVLMGYCLFLAGCSGFSTGSNASSQTPSQPVSTQTVLPSATVGSSYHTVLSVSGGQAPYIFALSQGELPPGLVLNPLIGSLSGILTQAGTFKFTITITSEPVVGPRGGPRDLAAAVGRTYTMTVSTGNNRAVTVQISPLDPSIAAGGKIQFAAAVSNTSNTAVTWSASAGTISSSGLFTAPSTSSAQPITVMASNAEQSTAKASTGVTITTAPITTPPTSSPFVITTSSVPPAVVVTPYAASLAASGGQPPYHWGVASGSLPAGLQLGAGTGTLSGSSTQAGTYTFIVQGTDAASHTAQRSLSLIVSAAPPPPAPASNCGPPAYNCSRSDLQVVQVPSTPPNMGGLLGANTIVTDPNFGNRIVRVTDGNVDPTPVYKNRTYETAASGSADDNLWNTDSTLFIVQDTGTGGVPYTFDPSTFQAGRLYASSFPATNGMKLPGGGIWSHVNPNILYTYSGTVINKYDFTDRMNPPSPQAVYDFTSSPNCLPAGFTVTWDTVGGVSGDDSVFGMGYSNAGSQETGVYVVAYKAGSGCSVLNTQTGQVSGDWGASGTINIADRWTIHNVKMSKDGNWMIISSNICTSASCSQNPYFWQIGTTNVSSCGVGGYCGGHFTEGYTHWVNNNNSSPWASQVIRAFATPTVASLLTTQTPPSSDWAMDQHQSWNNVQPGDSLPLLSTTCTVTSPFTAPWDNEIIGIAPDGSGKTWRFAHNFISTRSLNFSTQIGIGTVSQDGKFFLFSSDWMGNLGSESGAATCTLGSDCRGDVFVVELK